MTLVERSSSGSSAGESDSIESRVGTDRDVSNPTHRAVPEASDRNVADDGKAPGFAQSAWGKLTLRAAGIAALMLGLGGVGALATAHGQSLSAKPVPAPTVSANAESWLAQQASLTGPSATEHAHPHPTATSPTTAPAEESSAPAASTGLTADGKVVLNQASLADLRKLPGLGQKRAQAVLDLRQKLGKFRRVSDLLRIKGIGPKRLKQWQGKVIVDPEPAPKVAPTTPSSSPPPASAPPAGESHGGAT